MTPTASDTFVGASTRPCAEPITSPGVTLVRRLLAVYHQASPFVGGVIARDAVCFLTDLLRCRVPVVQVSLTTLCNLECDFCHNPRLAERTTMTFDQFVDVYRAFRRSPVWVISGIGEFTCSRYHGEIIEYLSDQRRYLIGTSNFTLYSPTYARFHELYASIDSEHFDRRIERVLARVVAERGGRLFPILRGRIVLGEREMRGSSEIVRNPYLQYVDAVELSFPSHYPCGPLDARAVVSALQSRGVRVSMVNGRNRVKDARRCRLPRRSTYITEFGTLLPCCWQLHNPAVYLKYLKRWKLADFDRALRRFADYDFCDACPLIARSGAASLTDGRHRRVDGQHGGETARPYGEHPARGV